MQFTGMEYFYRNDDTKKMTRAFIRLGSDRFHKLVGIADSGYGLCDGPI